MVIELAILRLWPGHGPGLEDAFDAVRPLLSAADGYLRHRLVRTVDDGDTFLLEVAWRDIEAHVKGFEPSEAHARFMAALEPHLREEPVVIHVPHEGAARYRGSPASRLLTHRSILAAAEPPRNAVQRISPGIVGQPPGRLEVNAC